MSLNIIIFPYNKMNQLLVFILIFSFLAFQASSIQHPTLRIAFFTLLLYALFVIPPSLESFRFEVTPWKKTCLNKHPYRCQGCCLPGFNGSPQHFEYTGDDVRMNDALTCYQRSPGLKNRVNDYATLEPVSVENYEADCGC
jgi:hypothetical protein